MPKADTQFKPGKSGNTKGRQKGTKNLKTDLLEELSEKIAIKQDGKPMTVSKQKALLKALTASGIKGDTKSANVVLNLVLRLLQDDPDAAEPIDLTATDLEILASYEASILAKAKGKKSGKGKKNGK